MAAEAPPIPLHPRRRAIWHATQPRVVAGERLPARFHLQEFPRRETSLAAPAAATPRLLRARPASDGLRLPPSPPEAQPPNSAGSPADCRARQSPAEGVQPQPPYREFAGRNWSQQAVPRAVRRMPQDWAGAIRSPPSNLAEQPWRVFAAPQRPSWQQRPLRRCASAMASVSWSAAEYSAPPGKLWREHSRSTPRFGTTPGRAAPAGSPSPGKAPRQRWRRPGATAATPGRTSTAARREETRCARNPSAAA
jgi:hypothetical protein